MSQNGPLLTNEQESSASSESSVPDYATALQRHVRAFSEPADEEGNLHYDGSTVADTLSKAGSKGAGMKGPIISLFNAVHSGQKCPFWKGSLPNGDSAVQALHLGTTRIWGKDFKIDSERKDAFIKACAFSDPSLGVIFKQDAVKQYLVKCAENDPEELDTGRNSQGLLSSKYVQTTGANKAWDELFSTYKSGIVSGQPYLTKEAMELFFEDTNKFVKKFEQNNPRPQSTSADTSKKLL